MTTVRRKTQRSTQRRGEKGKEIQKHRAVRVRAEAAAVDLDEVRAKAKSVATVNDDCCSIPARSWTVQGASCFHDCHFSEYADASETGAVEESIGPILEAEIVKEQHMIETGCGDCGKVFPDPSSAVVHQDAQHPLTKGATHQLHRAAKLHQAAA